MDDLTLFDVADLLAYWKTTPPVHVSVAALIGTGGTSSSASQAAPPSEDELQALAAQYGTLSPGG